MTNDTCKYSHHENPGSNWSKTNKIRARKLIKNGLMQPAGMEKVNAARKDSSWIF